VGDEADTLFVLGRGGVELTLPLSIFSADREVVLQQLGAGATLAWAALVAVRVLAMGARATVDTELVGFGREDLLALFGARPALGYRVMTNLATIIGRRLDVTHALWIRELQRSVGERYR
jgi:CRP-like cAMP-binding protein